MQVRELHRWEVAPGEAIEIQNRLREQVILSPLDVDRIRFVAGADISFDKGSDQVFAGVVVVELPPLRVVEEASVTDTATFPYIPGLLSFRESPAVLKAFEKLTGPVDAVMLDGQGLAHPRRMGIACHVGLLLDCPAVGCAKSLLVGTYDEPGPKAGSYSPLMDHGELVGVALRTKEETNPVFVSPGHKIDLDSSIRLVMRCAGGYRQPEPTRQAHLLVNRLRRGEEPQPQPGMLF